MADNYRQWSEIIRDLTYEEITWIREDLTRFIFEDRGIEKDGEFVKFVDEEGNWTPLGREWLKEHPAYTEDDRCWPGFEWSIGTAPHEEHAYLWLHGGDSGNLEHVADFIYRFIRKFRPHMVFTLTWAEWCLSLRVGEFGGGWFVAHKDGVTWGYAHDEARVAVDRIENPWLDDKVQFARLLSEMNALDFPDEDSRADLCESLDLTEEELAELFGRAQRVWEDAQGGLE